MTKFNRDFYKGNALISRIVHYALGELRETLSDYDVADLFDTIPQEVTRQDEVLVKTLLHKYTSWNAWSSLWPELPGWYWFYGTIYGSKGPKYLYSVRVVDPCPDDENSSELSYILNGEIINKNTHLNGVWATAAIPYIPEDKIDEEGL